MKTRSLKIVALVLVAAALRADVSPAALPELLRIDKVPHVLQKPDFCGEACVEMYLRKLGHTISQDDVFNLSGVDPSLARGCHTAELARAVKALGFKPGVVWNRVKATSAKGIAAEWEKLRADLASGIPSIVCMRTGTTRSATEHFRLVLGYDREKEEVLYHEPAEAGGSYRRMALKKFLECWPLKYRADTWTVIRLAMVHKKIVKSSPVKGFSDADFAQHMIELKKKLPDKGFTIAIEKPFVVIGDEAPVTVKLRAERTVRWATRRLKRSYFEKDPEHIIDIWLFKDKKSYRKHTKEIFGDTPDTPFGYSSQVHRALIMNISTGGGTLVHEIVHPFMAANFPECPAWLNEGMGSLYEQSSGRGEDIVGLTNWRLRGLQDAIKKDRVPSFETLTSTTTFQFYQRDPGTNYSQARYLCYYLQEEGCLKKFYHKFKAAHAKDPTGYETLKKVLAEDDMAAFKKRWQKYVLALRFP